MNLSSQKGFFGLAALLVTAAILIFLYFTVFEKYFTKPAVDQTTDKQLKEMTKSAPVQTDTSSYLGVKDSLTKQIHAAEQKELQRADEYQKQMQGSVPAGY